MNRICAFIILFVMLLPDARAAVSSTDTAGSAFTPQEQISMNDLVLRARRGSSGAAVKLADSLEAKGQHKEAERWYRQAFIQDNGRAGFALYHMHRQRLITLDNAETVRKRSVYTMEYAARNGDASSALLLGLAYLKGDFVAPDYAKSVALLDLARKQGKAMAAYHLGNIYNYGLFVPIQPRKAFGYYKEASEKGVAEATRQLGLSYLTGTYYSRNVAQAKQLLEQSVQQGSIRAMRDLANLYRYDAPDGKQYAYWMQKAADAGDSDAQYYMGAYLEGQNPARAKEYYLAAARKNHLMARQKLPGGERPADESAESTEE